MSQASGHRGVSIDWNVVPFLGTMQFIVISRQKKVLPERELFQDCG